MYTYKRIFLFILKKTGSMINNMILLIYSLILILFFNAISSIVL